MWRIALNVATAASLAIAVPAAAMWARSLWVWESVEWPARENSYELQSADGMLWLTAWSNFDGRSLPWAYRSHPMNEETRSTNLQGVNMVRPRARDFYVRVVRPPVWRPVTVYLTLWPAVVALAVTLPAARLAAAVARRRRARRRRRSGLCVACGYDVRCSAERCRSAGGPCSCDGGPTCHAGASNAPPRILRVKGRNPGLRCAPHPAWRGNWAPPPLLGPLTDRGACGGRRRRRRRRRGGR